MSLFDDEFMASGVLFEWSIRIFEHIRFLAEFAPNFHLPGGFPTPETISINFVNS